MVPKVKFFKLLLVTKHVGYLVTDFMFKLVPHFTSHRRQAVGRCHSQVPTQSMNRVEGYVSEVVLRYGFRAP